MRRTGFVVAAFDGSFAGFEGAVSPRGALVPTPERRLDLNFSGASPCDVVRVTTFLVLRRDGCFAGATFVT
jgi:hypothetical protein